MYLIEFVENRIDDNDNPYVTECTYISYSTKDSMLNKFNAYIAESIKLGYTIGFRDLSKNCVDITCNNGTTQTVTCYEAKEV